MLKTLGPLALILTTTAPALAQTSPAFRLDELVFSASLTETERSRTGVTTQVITAEELRAAGNQQISAILARQPGLSVTQTGGLGGSTSVRIRGAGPALTAVYIDGILVNDPTGTSSEFNGFNTLTSSGIERIEIIRGSQSALYGGSAVAGVISITTKAQAMTDAQAPEQSYQVEAGSYRSFLGNYTYAQRMGDLSLRFGLNRARSDGFSSAEAKNGNLESDGFSSNGQTFAISYDITPQVTVGINGFRDAARGEFDEFGTVPRDGTPGDETSSLRLTGLRGFANWRTANWTHEFTLSEMRTDRSLISATVAAGGSTFASSFKGARQVASYQATTESLRNLSLTFGAEFREETARSNSTIGAITPVTTHSGFMEAIWSPYSDFDLSLGLRHEEYSTFGEQSSARLALSYRVTNQLALRASLANGFRAPALSESVWAFNIFGGLYQGNRNLRPETSQSAEFGLAYEFTSGAVFEATLFQMMVDDFMVYSDCTRDPGTFACVAGSQATTINAAGTTTFRGAELATSLPLGDRATLSGSYTYTDAHQASGARVLRVPYHNLTLGLDAELSPDWRFSANMRHVDNLLDRATVIGDNYTVFDTSLQYRLTDQADLYLRVENLTDHQYQTTRGFGTSDRAFYVGVRGTF